MGAPGDQRLQVEIAARLPRYFATRRGARAAVEAWVGVSDQGGKVSRRIWQAALVCVAAVLALLAAGCGGGGGGSSSGNVSALPSSSCSDIYYQGGGNADFLIASDLPLQGSGRTQTVQMTEAIKFVLKQHSFKAGKYKIGYQSCDDSTAQAGKWASEKCSANANAYASNKSVIGVIGTFNSGCAEIVIPVLNRAAGGPVAMVSPANTYVGLTHGGPGTAAGEPDKYYPTGKRNYIRIVAADDFQGAADALNAQQLGLKKIYILNDKEAYGLGVATDFKNSLTQLGITVAGFSAWNGKASSYTGLATKIKQAGADAVFLGGLICENGGKVIKDLRSVLGTKVTLLAPDGFTPISAVVDGAGQAAEGLYVSVAGEPNENLPANGKAFVKDFGATQKGGNVDPYSSYAAQATEVLLTAIEKSDGTRTSVTDNLLKTKVADGILGNFTINSNGDTSSNPVTMYRIKGGKQTTYKTITPPQSLVSKA
jgi:branched-chain amino acid transport system substrate-binding protein